MRRQKPCGIIGWMGGSYELIDHTGDAAARIRGATLEELFESAAIAMFDVMGAPSAMGDVSREIELNAIDYEDLLVRWLAEINFLVETEHEIYSMFKVVIADDFTLRGKVVGRKILPGDELQSIKAVTYHQIEVTKTATGYEAFVVLDM